jgi:hypothetical protein
MALEDVAEVSTEHREISAERLEESLVDDRAVVSPEVVLERGAGSGQENESEGSNDNETASDDVERVKIGAVAILVGLSYDFVPSTVMRTRLGSLENSGHCFPKGYARPPGLEFVPSPRANEAVVFEDFFTAGLHMPPHPVLVDI